MLKCKQFFIDHRLGIVLTEDINKFLEDNKIEKIENVSISSNNNIIIFYKDKN